MKATRWLVLCAALSMPTVAGPEGWCDLVFRDVARDAHVVVLAEVRKGLQDQWTLYVIDVLKGECPRQVLALEPGDLGNIGIKKERHVLLALNEDQRLAGNAGSMGACNAINVLPIHNGKLRARDRRNYDSRSGEMTLEQLRQDLTSGAGRWRALR